jgi:ATP-dependent Lon protease
VWPIAGLKEKLLAALRGGIKTVLIPEENAKDLVEISESIKKGLEIVPVSRMDEVLARAMTRKPEPIEWDETTTAAASEATPVEEEASTLTAHLTQCRGCCHFSKLHPLEQNLVARWIRSRRMRMAVPPG